MARCQAIIEGTGLQCENQALPGQRYCQLHIPTAKSIGDVEVSGGEGIAVGEQAKAIVAKDGSTIITDSVVIEMPEALKAFMQMLPQDLQEPASEALTQALTEIGEGLDKVAELYKCLSEWKDLHTKLQGLQVHFGPVLAIARSMKPKAARLPAEEVDPVAEAKEARERDMKLARLEGNWWHCKAEVKQLCLFAETIKYIGEPYRAEEDRGAPWIRELLILERDLGEALVNSNTDALRGLSDEFDGVIVQYLFQADHELQGIVKRLNEIYTEMLRVIPK